MKKSSRFYFASALVFIFFLIGAKLGYLNLNSSNLKNIVYLAFVIFAVPVVVIYREWWGKLSEMIFEKGGEKDRFLIRIKKMFLYVSCTIFFSMIMLLNVLTKTKFVGDRRILITKYFIRGSLGLLLICAFAIYLYYLFKKKNFRPKESRTKKIIFGVIIMLCFFYNAAYYFGWL